MIWLIITIAVILLYLFALAPRLSRRDAMRAFSGTMFAHSMRSAIGPVTVASVLFSNAACMLL